ncbi:RNA polymerase sigma factor [Streptomyces sp. NPDC093546]|uniref:RNA polymerase sigma factor n=1 Tax=Streptomyces sp. NPDC093546 TaxID=3366040 RepID=UPI00380D7553
MGTDVSDDRWQRAWSHREHLLKVARRRSMSLEDAEDAVHEAMLRAAEQPHLDDERLGAWLTTVTMRLCVDRYRQVHRDADPGRAAALVPPGPAPVDELVCDRAEARWLAVRSGELPARQAEALWLKSEDLDVGQVAHKMGLSYRTVESLLARARRTLRNSLAATLGLLLWLCGRGRPRSTQVAVAAASTAATLAVAGFVLPHVQDRPARERPASAPVTSKAPSVRAPLQPPPSASPTPTPTSAPSTRTPAERTPADRTAPPRPPLPSLPLPTPTLPKVPPLPGVPEVPEVTKVAEVPELRVPELPLPPVGLPVPVPTSDIGLPTP